MHVEIAMFRRFNKHSMKGFIDINIKEMNVRMYVSISVRMLT